MALKTNEGFRNNAIQDLSQQTLTVAMASSTSEDPPKKVDVSSQLPTNHDDSESVKGKSFNSKKKKHFWLISCFEINVFLYYFR